MRRALATATTAIVLLAAFWAEPAAAGVGAVEVVVCKDEPECWPAAFDFRPNGKELFYAERFTGEIRRFIFKGHKDKRWGEVGPVDGDGERGVLGLALDPDWNKGKKHRWVYVYYTHADPLENRVIRLRKRPGKAIQEQILLTIRTDPPASNHNAGVIHFGPDEKLYVVTGDQGSDPSRSQDLADPAGKVLRLNRNGNRPADNPIPGSLAYSFGHRNSFGFTFDPETGRVWQTENGPTCNDEVNLVLPGGNYAWGPDGASCPGAGDVTDTNQSGPVPRMLPEVNYGTVIVPTGAAFCKACGLGADVEGDLLVATFTGLLRDLSLNGSRDDVAADTVLYGHPSGILAVERRRNGQIFFSDTGGIHRLTGP